MDYYKNMQNAIDYIEDNIKDNVKLEDVAKVAGCSVPHLYRIFNAIVGYSIKEYARKRKLSNALYDLLTSKQNIIDIAFEYGFESHEAFTRAFKAAYGEPPSNYRKCQVEKYLFERINLKTMDNKNNMLIIKPNIICKEAKRLLGIERKINQAENIKYDLISKIQNDFKQIIQKNNIKYNSQQFFAVYDYNILDISKEDDQIDYTYFFGIELLEDNNIPSEMIARSTKKAKYAVFRYSIKEKTLNGEYINMPVYDYIDGVWLPNSGFELSEASDYEEINYNENFVDYCVSIK